MIKGFRDLEVWKMAIQLVKKIYLITNKFPREEIYGLTSQMRRAAISIPSNIAEGKTRQSKKDYTRFLYISLGSTAELETQIIIARELEYIDNKIKENLIEKELKPVVKILQKLINSLQTNPSPETRNPSPGAGKGQVC